MPKMRFVRLWTFEVVRLDRVYRSTAVPENEMSGLRRNVEGLRDEAIHSFHACFSVA